MRDEVLKEKEQKQLLTVVIFGIISTLMAVFAAFTLVFDLFATFAYMSVTMFLAWLLL